MLPRHQRARPPRARALSIVLSLGGLLLGNTRCTPAAGGAAPATAPAAPTAPTASNDPAPGLRARAHAIRERVARLGQETWNFWQEHGPDREHGGFYGSLDRMGHETTPTDKGLIQQSRHLWSVSTWYAYKSPTPEVRALADDLYRFLIAHFYDASSHEFYFKVDETGGVVESKKVLYAESFAIYGLVQYARVFNVPEAGAYALACFHAIDARAHDARYGGYDQTHDPAWLSAGAQKEMNTHIHLLESVTALYEYGHDAGVKQRLEELVRVCIDEILQKSGYQRKEFLIDWTPFGSPAVSYGHDIETSWLLLDAAQALGRPRDPAIVSAALSMGTHSADWGYDRQRGGYFEEGAAAGAPEKLEKIWWIQAEALPGLWNLYTLTHDTSYLDRLEATLGWIEQHQRDSQYGEWFWGVVGDGAIGPHGDHKSEEWKASYHTLRALLFTERRIRDWEGQPSAPGQP